MEMFKYITCVLFVWIIQNISGSVVGDNETFPKNFLFGVATSSYQIEGAWNEGGKGENTWDRLTHTHPEKIKDHSTGDIACNSYHKFREDIQLLVELGVHFYRFSLSWSRILPTGFSYKINEEGINYYNELINELLKYNITPMVTLYHWDLPQTLGDLGGWTNPLITEYFVDFAQVAFENFADRVKYWITINEPKQFCVYDYGYHINMSGISDYICGHNVLKAHAKVYHLYKEKYYSRYKGKISLAPNIRWKEPKSNHKDDINSAERMMEFILGWFANPIYSETGDYPQVMKGYIEECSLQQGFTKSRLPKFTQDEINYIKGTFDFFGVNYYTARLVEHSNNTTSGNPSFFEDTKTNISVDENWEQSDANWLKVVPWGLRRALKWIKDQYSDPEIFILENGYPDFGEIKDYKRISFLKRHLQEILKSIHVDGVKVIGYTFWSFLDNFEWRSGYRDKYGLFFVDFNDPNRTRSIKNSAKVYKKIIADKKIDWAFIGDD